MLIFQFDHFVKPEYVVAYKEAILENARTSIHEEGIIHFDIFQDQEARDFHLQTIKWKAIVLGQGMFARKGMGDTFEMLFPKL